MIDEKDLLKIMSDVEKIQTHSKVNFEHLNELIKELKTETHEQNQILRKIENLLEDCVKAIHSREEKGSRVTVALIWVVVGQIATVILTLFELFYRLSQHN